jgi:hypothetical protein
MGSVRDVRKEEEMMVKGFCDDVYSELEAMRLKLMAITDELGMTYGEDSQPFAAYKRHLTELADQIEWKLQILSHACPYEWKGSAGNVTSSVSVPQPEIAPGPEFSPGYVGG